MVTDDASHNDVPNANKFLAFNKSCNKSWLFFPVTYKRTESYADIEVGTGKVG